MTADRRGYAPRTGLPDGEVRTHPGNAQHEGAET